VWRLVEGSGRNVGLVLCFGLMGQGELVHKEKASKLEQPVRRQEEAVRTQKQEAVRSQKQEAVRTQKQEAVRTQKQEAVRTQDAQRRSDLGEWAAYHHHARRIHHHLLEVVAVVALEMEIGRGLVVCHR